MNRKQFFIVLLALAVIGGAGLVLFHRNQQSWKVLEAKEGDKVLPNFQINDVATIHIKSNGSDFNVVHTNDLWRVRERNDYPADFAAIRDFLLKIKDLKVVRSDYIGTSQLVRLDLADPGSPTNSGTLVEFKDAQGKLLASLLAGKLHPKPQDDSEPLGLHGLFDGRYILLPNDPHNALLVSDDLVAIAPDPGSWLNPGFFKAENINFISVVPPNAADSWEISRANDNSPWVLDNARPGEMLNIKVADDVGEILAFPTFIDVVPKTPALLSSLGLDKPIIVTILTDNSAYTLKVGNKGPDGNYPMTVTVEANASAKDAGASEQQEKFAREQALEPWIYDASSWIERVIHARSQMLETKATASEQTARQ